MRSWIRTQIAAILAVGLLVNGSGYALASAEPPTITAPVANIAAFRSQGGLAFVWGSRFYLLDGKDGLLLELPGQGTIVQHAWSADGQWLAYIVNDSADSSGGVLWLVGADGKHAHAVSGLPGPVASLTWSPAAAQLAVTLATVGSGRAAIWLVSPSGQPVASAMPSAPAWSPDGHSFAYVQTLPFKAPETRSDALYTTTTASNSATRRLIAPLSGIDLVGWWPNGKGLLYWTDPQHSASLAADGMDLFSMPLGSPARRLSTTLGYRDWLALSPSGSQVLLVSGAGRAVWDNKALALCDLSSAGCLPLPSRLETVSLDPAWSPTGDRIAFVSARDLGSSKTPNSAQDLRRWISSRTLWIASPDGTKAHQVAAGMGIYAPSWSTDGTHLLFVRDNSLWLIGADDEAPVNILGPFPNAPEPAGYYGYVSWLSLFDWSPAS